MAPAENHPEGRGIESLLEKNRSHRTLTIAPIRT